MIASMIQRYGAGLALTLIAALTLAACAPQPVPRTARTQAPVIEPAQQTAPQPAPQGGAADRQMPSAAAGSASPAQSQGTAFAETYRGPVKVAILLPLSGANAELGRAMLNAAQMAVFDVGAENFELLPRDTRGTAEGARRAISEARQEGAQLVLGPLFAPSVDAIKPVLSRYDLRAIAFSTDWTLAGDGVYVMGFLPFAQVNRVVGYARDQGLVRLGALVPQSAYGDAVMAALTAAVQRGQNIEITKVARFDPAQDDLSPVVREFAEFDARRERLEELRRQLANSGDEASQRALNRLEAFETQGRLPYDAVFLAAGGPTLRKVAPLLPFFDIDPRRTRMLGTGLWDDPLAWREAALLGGWYAAPAPGLRSDFEARYAAVYGASPPRLATLAYDATALAAKLGRFGPGGSPAYDHATLTNPSGFIGLDGVFRFGNDGLVERGLAVLEIAQGRARVIDNPPRSFRQLGF